MARQERGRFDLWRDISGIDMEKARELAARIELRGQAEDEVAARAAYLDLLRIGPGQRVLEIGCGSGVVLRDLARRVAPDGVAVGLDYCPALLELARELADKTGLLDRIELREGDARALPFGDAEFDAVLAVTALEHVPDGERAIPEMARVVRPGGRAAAFERDVDSLIVSHPDRILTRRIVAAYSDHASVDGWLARRLPGLLMAAGLRDVRVRAFTPVERGTGGFYGGLAERAAQIAAETGAISQRERRSWLRALYAEEEAGRFVGGMTHLFVWGIRALVMFEAEHTEAVAAEPVVLAEERVVTAVGVPLEQRGTRPI